MTLTHITGRRSMPQRIAAMLTLSLTLSTVGCQTANDKLLQVKQLAKLLQAPV